LAALVLAAAATAQTQPVPKEPPPAVPPASLSAGEWNVRADQQESDGKVRKLRNLHGQPVELEDSTMLFRADAIDWDESTGDVKASGHVYYRNFDKNEQIWADHLEYNTEDEKGKFYDVRGETRPKIVTRPGVLTSNSPFHFEGKWAERIGEKYILHDGWVTNCKIPKPWWRMRGPRFIIVPGDHATAYRSVFMLRKVPLLYAPFFYHSLQKEPRKSGFLMPTFVPSSSRGFAVGVGYFWAINRSYDLTYRLLDYTSRGYAHNVNFSGKPRQGTDYDAILYGVQDRGAPNSGDPPQKFGGLSFSLIGKSDLGHGWTARTDINYITSFRFRQNWTQSFNEAIGSEIHSVGFVNRNWSTYTVNAVFARLENFQQGEVPITSPGAASPHYVTDAVTIRKLPEVEFGSRDRQIWNRVPIWFSFDSSAGLLFRSQPVFDPTNATLIDNFQTSQFMNRSNLAPKITSALHWWDISLVPSFTLHETYYGEGQAPFLDRYRTVGTNLLRSARDFSMDLIFPSLARVFNQKTRFGDKLKHVIEPRVTYRYVTGVGSDFNRFIRFDETDLLSNTNELALSLTNRIYAKRGDSVNEIFTWELMQKRYFDPTFGGALVAGQRNVVASAADLTGYAYLVGPRSTSPIVSLLRASPIGGFGVQWQADYDPRRHGIVDSSFSVDYRWQKYFVSAGHNEVHTDPALTVAANQMRLRAGFGDPNHRGWNAAGEVIYDYRKAVVQYTTEQVTYNTDCCGISVQFHRFNLVGLRNENQFRIAFSVANISTTLGNLKKQDRLF
jgi:LPS-assembly protein